MDFKQLSKKKRVYLMIALALTGVLLWAFATAKLITHDFKRQISDNKQPQQEAIVKGIILTETKNDTKYWEVYGDTGHWDGNSGIAQLNGVLANFYKDNKVTMSLKSSKGTYNSESKVITLYEDTFIAIEGGITLNADKLTYVSSSDPIVAEGHIKVRKDNSLISTADKIIISPNYEDFKIIGNTVSKVYEDKK
ncbi:LPS export ABC transporter periplasmic protein LptC [bacterium]|nr:LPS export ABC transporter periplasmic protein LptC [bacterium]